MSAISKIYYKKYKGMIEDGLLTFEEALADVEAKVPAKWRDEVANALSEDYGEIAD